MSSDDLHQEEGFTEIAPKESKCNEIECNGAFVGKL